MMGTKSDMLSRPSLRVSAIVDVLATTRDVSWTYLERESRVEAIESDQYSFMSNFKKW